MLTYSGPKLPSLSIFFPCYNDAGTIASLVIVANRVASQVAEDWEVIVVNDGSEDNSLEILLDLQKQYPRLRVVDHPTNLGYGRALRSGFVASSKEFVFYTDGDGQYDPEELVLLVSHMQPGVGVVNGYKIQRHDPYYRIVIGWIYKHTVRVLFRLRIKDVDCDFRLIRRSVIQNLPLECDDGAICVEMVKMLQLRGVRFVEVPVHHYHRVYGRSQIFVLRRLVRGVYTVARLWYRICLRRVLLRGPVV